MQGILPQQLIIYVVFSNKLEIDRELIYETY